MLNKTFEIPDSLSSTWRPPFFDAEIQTWPSPRLRTSWSGPTLDRSHLAGEFACLQPRRQPWRNLHRAEGLCPFLWRWVALFEVGPDRLGRHHRRHHYPADLLTEIAKINILGKIFREMFNWDTGLSLIEQWCVLTMRHTQCNNWVNDKMNPNPWIPMHTCSVGRCSYLKNFG